MSVKVPSHPSHANPGGWFEFLVSALIQEASPILHQGILKPLQGTQTVKLL